MSEDVDVLDAVEKLRSGYEQVRVKDESNDRRYFTITPRIVKAYARNSHDLALWETVKDVAGEEGECCLNTDQLAILSGISTGQVSNSRKYWLKIGFLKGEIKKDPGYSQGVWHLSVPDLWSRNVEWSEKHPKISDRLAFRMAHKSLHRMKALVKPSPSEGKPSPSEGKNILIKKKQEEEEANRRKVEAEIQERTLMLGRLYADNFGYVTPLVKQFLRNAAIEYPDSSWYEPAFTVMLQSANHKSWNFVDTVLGNWIKHGFGWKPEPKKGAKHARKKDRKPGNSDSGGKPLSEAGQRTADAINKRRAAKKAAMPTVQ